MSGSEDMYDDELVNLAKCAFCGAGKRNRRRKCLDDDDDDDDETYLHSAKGWSMGAYTISSDGSNVLFIGSDSSKFPPMLATAVPGMHFPLKLSPDMVISATLKDEENLHNTSIAELARFLRTRGQRISRQIKAKAKLVAAVKNQLALERANPDGVTVYDPDNRSMLKSMLENRAHLPTDYFPDMKDGIALPSYDDQRWVKFSGVAGVAPMMMPSAVEDWYKSIGAKTNSNIRQLEEGIGLMQSLNYLDGFMYHLGNTEDNFCYFKMNCPATMRSVQYPVWICCSCTRPQGDGVLGIVFNIERAGCGGEYALRDLEHLKEETQAKKKAVDALLGCKAQCSEVGCIHVSCLVSCIENLDRPEASLADKTYVSKTSVLCRWNNPRDGDMSDPNQRADCLYFRQPSRQMTKEKNMICMMEGLSRAQFEPLEDKDKAALSEYVSSGNPLFKANMKALLACVKDDYGGRSCAAARQWHTPDCFSGEIMDRETSSGGSGREGVGSQRDCSVECQSSWKTVADSSSSGSALSSEIDGGNESSEEEDDTATMHRHADC